MLAANAAGVPAVPVEGSLAALLAPGVAVSPVPASRSSCAALAVCGSGVPPADGDSPLAAAIAAGDLGESNVVCLVPGDGCGFVLAAAAAGVPAVPAEGCLASLLARGVALSPVGGDSPPAAAIAAGDLGESSVVCLVPGDGCGSVLAAAAARVLVIPDEGSPDVVLASGVALPPVQAAALTAGALAISRVSHNTPLTAVLFHHFLCA